jgi:glycosyltransferase involved in cell wall biosynthesis
MISVLVLTLDEERNLPACLRSVAWSDDVVVLDSGSADTTVAIAREFGARVVQAKFANERERRAFAMGLPFKHPWVYNPDADEVTTEELRDEMLAKVATPGLEEVAFRVRFKTMLFGRWLRFSGLYPTWVVRLFRPEFVRLERNVNLRYVVEGREGRLRSHFLHHTFNNGFEAWIDKHNRYSSGEALETVRELESGRLDWRELAPGADPVARRAALKRLSMRLPFRPALRFAYMYVLRGGFLDGFAGLTYCRLLAMYEYMIVLKVRELRARRSD